MTNERTAMQQRMRDAVELNNGRMTKEAYLNEVHRITLEDGGSTTVEVLEKTAMQTPRMIGAGICGVQFRKTSEDASSDHYEIWLIEDVQTIKDTIGPISTMSDGAATSTAATITPPTTTVTGNVWHGITRRDPSDFPASEGPAFIETATGFVDDGDYLELMAIAFKKGYHHISEGPTGCGKTMAEKEFCFRTNLPLYRVNCKDGMTWDDLTGYMTAPESGGTKFIDGMLTRAVRYGGILYVDEMTFAQPAVLGGLNAVLDSNKLVLPMTGEILTAHPDFRISGSFNPGYDGTNPLNQATARRFAGRFVYRYLGADLEVRVIQEQSGVSNAEVARELVTLANDLRTLREQNDIEMDCGTATLVDCMGWLTDISLTRAVEVCIIGQAEPEDRQQVTLACRQRLADFEG